MFYEYQEFLLDCQMRKLASGTLKNYRNNLKGFLDYVEEKLDISDVEDIKKLHIQKYLKTKMDVGCKANYVNTILKVIRAFYDYLIESEYVTKDPTEKVRLIKGEKKIIETFTDEEVQRLISAHDGIDYLSVRNRTIIALQLDTGIRCTETIDIEFNDLLGDRALIHGKGNKQRLVQISPPMNKMLKQYKKSYAIYFHGKEANDKNFFLSNNGNRLTVEAIERVYKRAQKIANITREIRVSPHTSRHTYAVKMLETNDIFTVSKLLGHSSVSITETYLSSLTNAKLIDRGNIRSPLQTMKKSKK